MAIHTKLPIGILGATGMVGQRFIQLLENHPGLRWRACRQRPVKREDLWRGCQVAAGFVASRSHRAHDRSPADPEGAPKIISLRSTRRMPGRWSRGSPPPDAPWCPTPAPSAWRPMCAGSSRSQRRPPPPHRDTVVRRESGGYIVTNSNCTAMGPVLALKPIDDLFGIEQIFATSMQAVSGAGYPGVPRWTFWTT